MSDGLGITEGAGKTVATDDLTADGTIGGHVQLVKLIDGTDGGNTRSVVNARGLQVDPRLKAVRIQLTPTVSASSIYAAKDAVGGLLTFTNAVRASGGSGVIETVTIEDKGQQMAWLDLVLFAASIGAPTDNNIFAPSDAELLDCVGTISIYSGDYADFSTNSIATKNNVGLEFVLSGTSLYGALVARGTPTYTGTSDIIVTLTILQD